MSTVRKLANQTVVYGLGNIVPRLLNYLLVPLYTQYFLTKEYGVVTEFYSYVAFLVVLLTYGMETAFFRFLHGHEKKEKVYSTALYSLAISGGAFIIWCILWAQPIAEWMLYPNHADFVVWFAVIVSIDAFCSIPLARYRADERPGKFAYVNMSFVGVNILFNIFFIVYCKGNFDKGNSNWLIDMVYNPELGVGYVFISNLIASVVRPFLLIKEIRKASFKYFDWSLLRKMFRYSYPLLIAGLAGIANETLDRIMLKRMLYSQGSDYSLSQVGIYGANYKLAVIITLFIQAFRYAAEPFFFAKSADSDSKRVYSTIMTYFVMVLGFMFLFVSLNLDIFKEFIRREEYWEGLHVVPPLLVANIFLGIYYNQSIWYKLSNQTRFGAYIAIFGALLTIGLNLWLIPIMGYTGSAWATVVCYGSMMLLSYFMGKKYYSIPYDLPKISLYLVLAIALYFISTQIDWGLKPYEFYIGKFAFHAFLILVYLSVVYFVEKPNLKFLKR